jgi:hypothetical protein
LIGDRFEPRSRNRVVPAPITSRYFARAVISATKVASIPATKNVAWARKPVNASCAAAGTLRRDFTGRAIDSQRTELPAQIGTCGQSTGNGFAMIQPMLSDMVGLQS